MKFTFTFLIALSILPWVAHSQSSKLTIQKIMQDPKWIGASPKQVYWGIDNKVYFMWNPDNATSDSLYKCDPTGKKITKLTDQNSPAILSTTDIFYSKQRTSYCYNEAGDIFYVNEKKKVLRVTQTAEYERIAGFDDDGSKIIYLVNDELFSWNVTNGQTTQIFLIKKNRTATTDSKKLDTKDAKLTNEQYRLFPRFKELNEKNANRKLAKKVEKNLIPYGFQLTDDRFDNATLSPDGNFISFRTSKSRPLGSLTMIPEYVTRSGYTSNIDGRSKVGENYFTNFMQFYDFQNDSLFHLDLNVLPGIKVIPDFYDNYPTLKDSLVKLNKAKECKINDPVWSANGHNAIIQVYSYDFKDRWICWFSGFKNQLITLDHQHDEAWIGGPLCGSVYNPGYLKWLDNDNIIFSSEVSGYSHLYLINVKTGIKKSLTQGSYEVQHVFLSIDKKDLFLVTNQSEPGSHTIVKLNIASGKNEIITNLGTGLEDVCFSKDFKYVAFLSSSTNIPWELYIQEARTNGKLTRITDKSRSEEFSKYPWRILEIVKVTARDGKEIYSRLYKPKVQDPLKPAVIFVHGAGYLQNAHKWWSYYFREYMFHNMLADLGYTVLDMDYRASAGYGRDVRTDIYRFMGGKDLTDQVDGAKYLVANCGVDAARIGIYGGSYGGFITLMALFTEPDIFKAGAALRPVTDWEHYNHGYTAQILNTPVQDSIAYARSSPINFAEGLKNRLLICHGMIDVNVHFQDVVRLQQRLIDLGKDNWEVAAYPTQDHGFTQPESWTDEYKRIFKLFEEELRGK